MTEKVNNYIEPDAQGLLVMCLLAIAAGIISGIGAWGFRMLIGWVHNVLFLGKFSFLYDANVHTEAGPWGMGVILVPVLGGLLVAWLVKNFAPEAKGHGVPEVMDAIHYNHGLIRPRVAIIKSLASAISIGSGAAVGREGPIIQIGSAFGSMLGQVIRMPTRQCIALIVVEEYNDNATLARRSGRTHPVGEEEDRSGQLELPTSWRKGQHPAGVFGWQRGIPA